MNLSELKYTYREMADLQLLKLARESRDLKKDALPVLHQELTERGFMAAAAGVYKFLHKNYYQNFTIREIRDIIIERETAGESMESIARDLEENGLELQAITQADEEILDQYFFSTTSSADVEWKKEIKSRANLPAIFGVILLAFAFILFMMSLSSMDVQLWHIAILFFSGLILILKGTMVERPR